MAAPSKASKPGSKKVSSKSKAPVRTKSSSGAAASSKTAKEQKSKPANLNAAKKRKRRVYSEKELDIPKLNTITPVGVKKPKGKKKGKVFVDDKESMMTILAMVNADKEGQIESKMIKARQMEEIRQARQKEMEARQEQRQNKLEATKNSLRRQRRNKDGDSEQPTESLRVKAKSGSKRVSFK